MAQAQQRDREPAADEKDKLPAPASAGAGTALQAYDFGADAGAGMDNASKDELITPMLRVLHYQAPELVKSEQAYIPGAAPGLILNTATKELFDGEIGLDIIICARDHHYGEWIPRAKGGGYRGMHRPEASLVAHLKQVHGAFKALPHVNDKGEDVELIETGQFFVLYGPPELTSGNARRAIVPFTSTSLNAYKSTVTRHNDWLFEQPDHSRKPAPAWAYRWRLTAQPTSNDKGQFFIWRVELAPPAKGPMDAFYAKQDPALFRMGKDFAELYRSGAVKYDPAQAESGVGAGGSGSGRQPGEDDDRDPPF